LRRGTEIPYCAQKGEKINLSMSHITGAHTGKKKVLLKDEKKTISFCLLNIQKEEISEWKTVRISAYQVNWDEFVYANEIGEKKLFERGFLFLDTRWQEVKFVINSEIFSAKMSNI
jgi:hypothetical protein